jgi:CO/xanthine dehydrogenase Mo-binding subunit
VVAVLTHADIPGVADYGLRKVDRPVLCRDKVRYVGDPVAAIAAVDLATAYAARELIRVDYEPAAGRRPAAALAPDLPPKPGCMPAATCRGAARPRRLGRRRAATVHWVEDRYTTPRQMHAFLETEGGVAEPDGQGGLRCSLAATTLREAGSSPTCWACRARRCMPPARRWAAPTAARTS